MQGRFDPRFRRRRRLLSWVEQSAGREVVDLASLWRDGTILCDVIHRTCPSSCHGWEDSHNKNTFRHAQALAYRCLLLQPAFSEVDLNKTEMTPNIEKRLFRYLQSLKLAVCKKHLNRSVDDESDAEVLIADEYIARGMGLIMGSRNHKAIFYIYSR
ncbi:hypothetical protein J6590_000743 [Homalodisca vitripennis]|nr:hypothetical protein J6590_000743 [Homalodisca vitripennis]